MVPHPTRGTTTNAIGRYSLRLTNGRDILRFSAVAFNDQNVPVDDTSGMVNVSLSKLPFLLNKVAVSGLLTQTVQTRVQTPVPVKVICEKGLKAYAQTDSSQILTDLALFFHSDRQTIADGTDHLDLASLRGLGPDQVVLFLNGKRRDTTALVNSNETVGKENLATNLTAIPVATVDCMVVNNRVIYGVVATGFRTSWLPQHFSNNACAQLVNNNTNIVGPGVAR